MVEQKPNIFDSHHDHDLQLEYEAITGLFEQQETKGGGGGCGDEEDELDEMEEDEAPNR